MSSTSRFAYPYPFPSVYSNPLLHLQTFIFHTFLLQGLTDAKELLVTGCSAGGMAVFLHLDYIASKVFARLRSGPSCLPPKMLSVHTENKSPVADARSAYIQRTQLCFRAKERDDGC